MHQHVRRTGICGLSLAVLSMTLGGPAAAARWQWTEHSTPDVIAAVAVAPNDVPFVQGRSGRVWFLQPPAHLGDAETWVSLPGITSYSLTADIDGTMWALNSSGIPSQPTGNEDPNFHPVSGMGWRAAALWGSACASSMTTTGVGPDLTEAFLTPLANNWDRYDWIVRCPTNATFPTGTPTDSSIWVLHRWRTSGVISSSDWMRVAGGQHATTAHLATFLNYGPAGAVQDVWLLDSEASGGLTWVYNKGQDRVINVPNPFTPSAPGSTKPTFQTVGTALTDHYGRFRDPNSLTGWVYRWDDAAQAWTYVIGDPTGARIAKIASFEAYNYSRGQVGASRLWAVDTSGRLYYLTDVVK